VAFDQQGDILRDEGRLADALKLYRDSLDIRMRLTRKDPGNTDWLRDLAVSYDRVGDVLRQQGQLTDALRSLREHLSHSRLSLGRSCKFLALADEQVGHQ